MTGVIAQLGGLDIVVKRTRRLIGLLPLLADAGARSLIRNATEAQARRDWQTALELWQAVTRRQPRLVNGWLQLGNMHNELAHYADAIAAFDQAQQRDPTAAEPLAGIAGVHERAGDWPAALAFWTATLRLLEDPVRARRPSDERHVRHALAHAATAAGMARAPEAGQALLEKSQSLLPRFADSPAGQLFRAQLLRGSDPRAAMALLRGLIASEPANDDARYEFGAIALDHADPSEALTLVEPGLARRGGDVGYLRLVADLHERRGAWSKVRELAERMAALAPAERQHRRRALHAALTMRDMPAARRLARADLRAGPDGVHAVHDLAQGYERDGEFDRARLLFRFVARRWPHSEWHAARVVILTAVRWSLPEADRLLRRHIDGFGRRLHLDRAYYEAAFRSCNATEARRRLEWFITEHPKDEAAALLLGYVIANTTGLADAERYFLNLAARSFQAKGALVGAAHMAMRRRDTFVVHERWAIVVGVYPGDAVARVEYARSAYEIRDIALTLQICQTRLAAVPGDVTMGEFYAWLLCAIGRFEDAWTHLQTLRWRAGAGWTVLDLLLLSAARTGRLDAAFTAILDSVPGGGARDDGARLYHAVRMLCVARRPDLVPSLVQRAVVAPRHLPWLAPYLRPDDQDMPMRNLPVAAGAQAAWSRTRLHVRSDVAAFVAEAQDAAIAALLSQPRHNLPIVHIVNKFEQPRGGSELHALDLAERLGKHTTVALWAPEMPHPHFSEVCGVTAIELGQGRVPHGGVLVIIGVYFDIAPWIRRARPERVIFLYNTFEAPLLFDRIHDVHEQTGIRPELLYCSDMMGHETGLPGAFEPSPVDIALFSPRAEPFEVGHRFTIGRHSRDVIEKHHPKDWKVYGAVAELGGASKLLGGTCMQRNFPQIAGITFLPARSDRIVEFLHELDCYYYNTSTWIEPWGRVVVEAMACGLPVLASDTGGYAQLIEHGRNGLLFHTVDEAVELMRQLAGDAALRRRLGSEARASVEALLGQAGLDRLVAFYLAPQGGALS